MDASAQAMVYSGQQLGWLRQPGEGGQRLSKKTHNRHYIYKLTKITKKFSLLFNFIFINLN
jgi:hypothetical protein